MDQGVIRSFKAKYRINVVRKIISFEKNKTLLKISLLHGMQMLISAWNAFTTETIVNCFRKAGISAENQDADIAEDDHFTDERERGRMSAAGWARPDERGRMSAAGWARPDERAPIGALHSNRLNKAFKIFCFV